MAQQKTVNIYVEIFCKQCKKKSEHSGSAPLHLVSCTHCGSSNFSFYGEQTEKTSLAKELVAEVKKNSGNYSFTYHNEIKASYPLQFDGINFFID